MDKKVQSLTCEPREISQIFSWIEDQNELLMYIVDILGIEELDSEISDMIMMSLLNIAYFPGIINSLVDIKSGGKVTKFSLNTCIFILIQTIQLFSQSPNLSAQKFIKIIVSVLFTN